MTDFLDKGYNHPLFILPFDHRTSFEKEMFGISNGKINALQKRQIVEEKKIIYEGFKKAVLERVPKEQAAILVDEEFGDEILKDAIKNNFIFCLTTEKSGQKEFDFEYGDNFSSHIEKYKPKFVKALVRYNLEEDQLFNKRQEERLKVLNNYCENNNYKFLLEVLTPPTQKQLESINGSLQKFEIELKPLLTQKAIVSLKAAGINPDIWKIEGMSTRKDYENVVLKIKENNNKNVGIIILGRGEIKELVEDWIKKAAEIEGINGFAIGRTIFWQPIIDYSKKELTKEQAIDIISKNYQHFYQLFIDSKKS